MDLYHLREEIDDIDTSIIALIAERLELAKQTRALKQAARDPQRDEQVKKRWRDLAEENGVSPDLCLAVLDQLRNEAVRLQEESA